MDKALRLRFKHVNILLVLAILAINGYILVSPLLPRLDLWWRQRQTAAVAGLPYKTRLDKSSPQAGGRSQTPSDNRLVIPKIALDDHIYVGTDPHLVNRGVWNKSNTSSPSKGGNSVIIAHRFNYTGTPNFYSLDKVSPGDKVVVYWQSKEYDYTVKSSKIVEPTDIAVENQTAQAQLTLYTCTPLWSSKQRLVVVAALDKGQKL
jgi:LPXTG-site transpeptidase (sortase) family protein